MSKKNNYEIGEVKWAKYDNTVNAVIGKLKDKKGKELTFQIDGDIFLVEGDLLQFIKEESKNIDIVQAKKI